MQITKVIGEYSQLIEIKQDSKAIVDEVKKLL